MLYDPLATGSQSADSPLVVLASTLLPGVRTHAAHLPVLETVIQHHLAFNRGQHAELPAPLGEDGVSSKSGLRMGRQDRSVRAAVFSAKEDLLKASPHKRVVLAAAGPVSNDPWASWFRCLRLPKSMFQKLCVEKIAWDCPLKEPIKQAVAEVVAGDLAGRFQVPKARESADVGNLTRKHQRVRKVIRRTTAGGTVQTGWHELGDDCPDNPFSAYRPRQLARGRSEWTDWLQRSPEVEERWLRKVQRRSFQAAKLLTFRSQDGQKYRSQAGSFESFSRHKSISEAKGRLRSPTPLPRRRRVDKFRTSMRHQPRKITLQIHRRTPHRWQEASGERPDEGHQLALRKTILMWKRCHSGLYSTVEAETNGEVLDAPAHLLRYARASSAVPTRASECARRLQSLLDWLERQYLTQAWREHNLSPSIGVNSRSDGLADIVSGERLRPGSRGLPGATRCHARSVHPGRDGAVRICNGSKSRPDLAAVQEMLDSPTVQIVGPLSQQTVAKPDQRFAIASGGLHIVELHIAKALDWDLVGVTVYDVTFTLIRYLQRDLVIGELEAGLLLGQAQLWPHGFPARSRVAALPCVTPGAASVHYLAWRELNLSQYDLLSIEQRLLKLMHVDPSSQSWLRSRNFARRCLQQHLSSSQWWNKLKITQALLHG
uniref:Reverse transcriptase domain-containing protein n=1 Tax=Macrostomum lignano TaxID=282301 RepID=A0A1I8FDH8_9PLAT